MIAHLKGTIESISTDCIIIDVNGVGYQVYMPYGTLISMSEVGKHVTILTKHLVREDSVSLYGFLHIDELTAFDFLLGIQGIGPKAALSVLSTFSPSQLKEIVSQEDFHALMAVSGIGRKTAQRMVIDLAEKMKKFTPRADTNKITVVRDLFSEAKEALNELGFSSSEIDKALRLVRSQEDTAKSVQEVLKGAMKIIKNE